MKGPWMLSECHCDHTVAYHFYYTCTCFLGLLASVTDGSWHALL